MMIKVHLQPQLLQRRQRCSRLNRPPLLAARLCEFCAIHVFGNIIEIRDTIGYGWGSAAHAAYVVAVDWLRGETNRKPFK